MNWYLNLPKFTRVFLLMNLVVVLFATIVALILFVAYTFGPMYLMVIPIGMFLTAACSEIDSGIIRMQKK